jgi:hypothetical protein
VPFLLECGANDRAKTDGMYLAVNMIITLGMAMTKAGHSLLHAKEVVVGLGFRVLWVMVVMGPAAGLKWGHSTHKYLEGPSMCMPPYQTRGRKSRTRACLWH